MNHIVAKEQAVRERFLKDIEDHKMTILHDEGLYRHLLLKMEGSSFYWFEVVTSPNLLTVNGDMGTFTFTRTDDMFTFFRGDSINPGYWEEKLAGRYVNTEQYSPESAIAQVTDLLADLKDEVSEEAFAELTEQGEEIISQLRDAYSTEEAAQILEESVLRTEESGDQTFSDVWEMHLTEPSTHFLWNLWAIVHAIQQYDATKTEEANV